MNMVLRIVSWIGLVLTLLPSLLFLAGSIEQGVVNRVMAAGMIVWFAARILSHTLFLPKASEALRSGDPL